MKVLPYKMTSRSAKTLAQALGVKRVRPDGRFRNNYNQLIINWGYSGTPTFPIDRILNHPRNVSFASNKLNAFTRFSLDDVPVPEWTTDIEVAREWHLSGMTIVSRTLLNSHSGRGMVIQGEECYAIKPAPLYVQYIKKQDEYRYHVFNGDIIDVQQKRKRRDIDNDEVNYQIRSAHTGWVYCRDDVNPHPSLSSAAIRAVSSLGLDFGAVDIIWNARREQGYVLEVNTACGLDGSTVDKYVEAIWRHDG